MGCKSRGRILWLGLFLCLIFLLPSKTYAELPHSGEMPITLSSEAYVQNGHTYYGVNEMIAKLKSMALARDGSSVSFTLESDSFVGTSAFEKVLFDYVFPAVYAHTGSPAEGDYLYCGMNNVRTSWDLGTVRNARGRYEIYVRAVIEYRTTAAQERLMNSRLSSVLASLPLAGKSTYGKLKTMYDWVVKNVTYDKVHLSNPSYLLQFTAYAALVNRTAVCQGYASLFYRMCLSQGINARVVFSQNHAWNIVRLGDYYYNVDATAGAGAKDPYQYFLKNNTDIGASTHQRLPEFLTPVFLRTYPIASRSYSGAEAEVTKVQLSTGSLVLKVGKSATLTASITPQGADKVKSYAASNPSVATVSKKGKVKAKKAGSCVITMTTSGGIRKTCQVTVLREPVTGIAFGKKVVTVKAGKKKQLSYKKLPAGATEGITFTSSRPAVAKVSSTGMLTGVKSGRTVVTAKSVSGLVTATCIVVVP